MRRLLWLIPIGGVLATVALGLLALNREPEWTTDSPEALQELEAALVADGKLYYNEARSHLDRALELDPDLAIAKIFLANNPTLTPAELRLQLVEEAKRTDLEQLSQRERFLIAWADALLSNRFEQATELVEKYCTANPDDPYGLQIKAEILWGEADLTAAEHAYQRLLEISPNRVAAYNNLGYLAMSQGQFTRAEELFTSYRFIVPDQANPHDSLGDLYLTVGRFEDAIACFEKAISIHPEFWQSYRHLVIAYCLQGSFGHARTVIERARRRGTCPYEELRTMVCAVSFLEPMLNRSWQRILDLAPTDCLSCDEGAMVTVIIHRAACQSHNWRSARLYENAVKRALQVDIGPQAIADDDYASFLVHMQAVRLALSGRLDEATLRLQDAERALTYAGSFTSILKLWNRLILVEVLRARGQHQEAAQLLNQIRRINPPMTITYRDYLLGLGE